ncbi:MAG: hypothetical protein AAB489_00910 [Patescibacteria group bacterium]
MKHPSTLRIGLLSLLLFSGCGAETVSYEIKIRHDDPEKRTELIAAAKRVVERRLQAVGEEAVVEMVNENGKLIMHVGISEEVTGEHLSKELTAPFSMRIMTEAPEGKGDVMIEGQGTFKETGITEEDLLWVTASKDTDPAKGRVLLEFSAEGRNLMGDVFRKNNGKYIGLFVRKLLVSKLLVESSEVKESILITDIPQFALAEIFADDLNTGLHVTFVPQK